MFLCVLLLLAPTFVHKFSTFMARVYLMSSLWQVIFFINVAYNNFSSIGNIIPAIATSNAIVAGLMVVETYKVIRNQENKFQSAS